MTPQPHLQHHTLDARRSIRESLHRTSDTARIDSHPSTSARSHGRLELSLGGSEKFCPRTPLATWALLVAGSFGALTSYGQVASSEEAPLQKEETLQLEKYEVTGSLLRLSASVTASPVVRIQSSDIGQSGATDPLRLLRQMTPFFSGSGNFGTEANNGAAGESYVALRNLTTLVLINGQRLVGSPFVNGTATDLNTIPTSAIDHIDILKDGASTIYGTDAIGGVINVILKKDYTGFEMGGRYGTTKNGDYKTREVFVTGGASANGFSVTLTAQHFENTPLLTTDRSLATLSGSEIANRGFYTTSAVYSGTYPGRVNGYVLAGSTLIATGDPKFNANILSPGVKSSPDDTSVTGGFTGQAALNYLVSRNVYISAAATPAGQAVGGTATALNTTLFGNPLMENTRRNLFVGNVSKELIGRNLEVFSDFLYAQTVNGGSALAPSPVAGVGPAGQNTLFIPANNPYNVFNVDFPGSLSARTRTIELGKRTSSNETNTWRLVFGLKGEINDRYGWEATYNYSRASLTQRIFGGVNGANMNKAMVPLLDSNGNYVYGANGKPLSTLTDANGNNLPVYNFFALPGFNDPATLAALQTTLFQSGDVSLRNIQVIFRGKPFALPAGNVAFALGGESRSEDLSASVDALFANGLALGYPPANTFSGGSRSSKGAFLEVGVPLISAQQTIPGFHTVDLNLADRYEKIQPGGNANSPKFGLRWMPFDDSFTIRATYAKGFIAPSIFNLFGPAVGNAPTVTLPLGDGSVGPGGSLGTATTIQISASQLSNPNLPSSISKSYTAGFVYSPKQIKGLSFTADYYHITQDGVGGLDYTAIVADLNAKGSGSKYAPGFVFATGAPLTSTAPNQVTSTNFGQITVQNAPSGTQWTDGLDLSADYTFTTGSLGRFNAGAVANILFNYKARASASDPYFQYARNFTDGSNGGAFANGLLPPYLIKGYINHTYGPVAMSIYLNFVPATNARGTLTTGFPLNTDLIGEWDLVDPDDPSKGITNVGAGNGYAITPYKIPSYFTLDLAVNYTLPSFGKSWARNTTLRVGVNNLFNKLAPYVPVDGNPPGENNTVESTYDIIGRFYFIELRKAF
jgi:iron complex outermembrane receptor protein